MGRSKDGEYDTGDGRRHHKKHKHGKKVERRDRSKERQDKSKERRRERSKERLREMERTQERERSRDHTDVFDRHTTGQSHHKHKRSHHDDNPHDDRHRKSHKTERKHRENREHRVESDRTDHEKHHEKSGKLSHGADGTEESSRDFIKNPYYDDAYDRSMLQGKESFDVHGNVKTQAPPLVPNMVLEDEDQQEDIGPDYDFDWSSHRRTLNSMFFKEEDRIERGSQEYDEFWSFLKKYQAFQKRKASEGSTKKSTAKKTTNAFGLPAKYDKRYKINISLPKKESQALYDRQIASDGRGRDYGLTVGRIVQFKTILLHFLDFVQKQKFAKLGKIKRDQESLPMYQYRQKAIDTVRDNQVVVIAGDTGCGKSTQVPQYLLSAGFTQIACTQPRRIACISLAKRVSYETLNEYGSEVAHQVRFEKTRTRNTRILFLTEGLLLRQIGSDPLLSQYSVIVIDEVHERHIHTDFLLGVLKCILHQRPELKLVLMSATINIDLFSGYFNGCPVVKVPGRLYPIELQYRPLTIDEQGSKSERLDPAPYLRILQLINNKIPDSERGDVLMFLSGMSEIMSVADAARAYAQKTKKWVILPLHSSMSIVDQDKVFDIAPDGVRKCIISTNIAETSVTIDGVRFVVDSGKVKEMSYDTQYKMQRLQEFWISTASSEQRKGRAGRTGPGVCYRLYAESDYDEFQQFSTPEIQRVPLDSLILQMIAMGLPDARKFPYLEAPSDSTIETSVAFLKGQGAITATEELTPIGQMLSQLPVDVVIGKMLIMASIFQMVDPVLTIAAGLSVQSPFTARSQRDAEAMNKRKDLESDHGDPITLLNAYDEWVQIKAEGRDTRQWCKRRGLEQQRFFEISKLKRQFQDLLHDYGLVSDLSTVDPSELSREERRLQNLDKKHLRDLRQQQRRQGKKRKVLKLEDEDWDVEMEGAGRQDAPDLEMDIKDLEFKLSNNLDNTRSSYSRGFTLRELTVLKVILCSGLMPQVAIADEHNNFKSESEQVFHTKNKGFVVLHPTGVFAVNPESLELREHEVKVKDTGIKVTSKRNLLSNRHQLLAFVSLLETVKPYLTGCLRVPALQTLLLFSTLDTNMDCTRVLCDGWLELTFDLPEDAESSLSAAVKLRGTWQKLLELKLQLSSTASMEPDYALQRTISRVQSALSDKLAEFLYSDVYYSVRRVMAAELKHAYVGPTVDSDPSSPLSGLLGAGGDTHPVKGGVTVTSYLTVNCLREDSSSTYGDYSACLQRHWACPVCQITIVVTTAERLAHEQQCQHNSLTQTDPAGDDNPETKDGLSGLRKAYQCTVCDQEYSFTTAEIFKHRKACR